MHPNVAMETFPRPVEGVPHSSPQCRGGEAPVGPQARPLRRCGMSGPWRAETVIATKADSLDASTNQVSLPQKRAGSLAWHVAHDVQVYTSGRVKCRDKYGNTYCYEHCDLIHNVMRKGSLATCSFTGINPERAPTCNLHASTLQGG